MKIEHSKIPPIIHAMDAVLQEEAGSFNDIGIKTGLSGLSLYNFAAARYLDSSAHTTRAVSAIEQIFEKMNTGYTGPTLFEELAEFGSFLSMCTTYEWIDADLTSTLEDIDAVLEKPLSEALQNNNIDPANGAIKYGYYYLLRREACTQADSLINQIVDIIYTSSQAGPDGGIYWISQLKQVPAVYLGISHGNASVILFLQQVREAGMAVDRCNELIAAARHFILVNEQSNAPLFFPIMMEETTPRTRFPNYYCYGDLGTLYSLLKTEQDSAHLLKILHALCDRIFDDSLFTEGFSLLYGWSGLAMLYRKTGQLLQDEKCMQTYQRLVTHIIDRFDAQQPYFGYPGVWNQQKKETNISYTEGLIGISLFLMSVSDSAYAPHSENYFQL
ncbi:lanthionine synthetase-like protein [Chitinophaga dinghuensis]|uniref:Lanthionine synthetase-like protein n=1 Tax=Chitinophaga dinghuensis TaxID=1539050 RepID=A0A327VRC6_9BACT|nr:lanthionine synthetase LanC family protein [Chitinophaga dinghuensis]RAJ76600.1 lanthionine synthetase-like protein [Chitinophaga dinghuensis]